MRSPAQTTTARPSKIQRTRTPAGARTVTATPGASGTAVVEMLEVVFAVLEDVSLVSEVLAGVVIEREAEPFNVSFADGL